MKKIILSLAIGLGGLAITPAMAQTPVFSASEMAQTTLRDLSFKEVMRTFYSGRMGYVAINDENIKPLPNVGLDDIDAQGERTIALMHPVLEYDNHAGEPRYLVFIEKVKINADSGTLVKHQQSDIGVDLYSFKQLSNGDFQLVSRTPRDNTFVGLRGRAESLTTYFEAGVEPLGKNVVGVILFPAMMSGDEMLTFWDTLHLPENDFIGRYRVGDAGRLNGFRRDIDTPIYYQYSAGLSIIENQDNYYPIQLNYGGTHIVDGKLHQMTDADDVTVRFDPIKKVYE